MTVVQQTPSNYCCDEFAGKGKRVSFLDWPLNSDPAVAFTKSGNAYAKPPGLEPESTKYAVELWHHFAGESDVSGWTKYVWRARVHARMDVSMCGGAWWCVSACVGASGAATLARFDAALRLLGFGVAPRAGI